MIQGVVNADHQAVLQLVVQGPHSREEPVVALIDTGFSGFLALPKERIAELELTWLGREEGVLADDSVELFDVYRAMVLWDGQLRPVEVTELTASALVGMGLLADHSVHIEVKANGNVTISPLPT
jgi:clan AA aspartic protease